MQQIKVSLYKFVNYGFRHSFTYPFVSNIQVMNPDTEWLRCINVPRTIAEKFHVSNEAFIMWRNHVGTYYAIVVPDGSRGKFQQVTMFVGQNTIASGAEVVDVLRKLKHSLVDLNSTTPQLVEVATNHINLQPDANPVTSPISARNIAYCNYESEVELNDILAKVENESVSLYNNVWIVAGPVEQMNGLTSLNEVLKYVPEPIPIPEPIQESESVSSTIEPIEDPTQEIVPEPQTPSPIKQEEPQEHSTDVQGIPIEQQEEALQVEETISNSYFDSEQEGLGDVENDLTEQYGAQEEYSSDKEQIDQKETDSAPQLDNYRQSVQQQQYYQVPSVKGSSNNVTTILLIFLIIILSLMIGGVSVYIFMFLMK